ncbi:ABC transporter permease [Zavarzinella formosa]|uniref:ABC transporter permease n=1 Tax=Zavarzinella formosa TaxID=360055 RepID=UPI0002FFDC40|nr:ABC transporter permease subunit [Zavarzinella formosa]
MRFAGRLLILTLLAVPLLLPLLELASFPVRSEAVRISDLLGQTLLFVGVTLIIALPPGLALAVILFRLALPLSGFVRRLLLLGVFVPLPVFACAWQPTLGYDFPWGRGIMFAALVHALAALPGVVWIIGLGLNQVPRELEEDARTILPPLGVFRRVTFPAIRSHVLAAIGWIVLQATGEITVTDMALVRTFAEEVYTQFVAGSGDGLGRAVAVSLPFNFLMLGIFACLIRKFQSSKQVLVFRPSVAESVNRRRWPLFVLLAAFAIGWAGVPLWNLIRQAAGHRGDTTGNFATFARELSRGVRLNAAVLGESIAESAGVGLITVGLAILLHELVKDSRWQRRLATGLLGALAITPGPVLGFGLLKAIFIGMDAEDVLLGQITDARPFRYLLYDGSTPAPVMAAHVLRFLPYAALVLWPLLGQVPTALVETARQEGATPWGQFRHITWPFIRPGAWAGGLMVTAFAVGEVSAGKMVQVPGRQTFVQELMNQMHYGVTSTVAALALVQLIAISGLITIGRLVLSKKSN